MGDAQKKAEEFLRNAFRSQPSVKTVQGFEEEKILGGGKSGAKVSKGLFGKKPAILKIYQIRDEENIFQSSRSIEEKVEEYRKIKHKKDKGDAVLSYIRSIRDIYLSILLQEASSNGEALIPKLYDYGIMRNQGRLQLFMIMENITANDFKELEKYDYKKFRRENIQKNIKILFRLTEALMVKHKSIRYEDKNIGCHRDLHPGNVFFKEIGTEIQIKFIDFDLSITNSDILNENKKCDRKTMSGSFFKKKLGNFNITHGKYLKRAQPLNEVFKNDLVENDADLYMLAGYISGFLYKTNAMETIKSGISRLNRISIKSKQQNTGIQKNRFLEILAQNLKKAYNTYSKRQLKY